MVERDGVTREPRASLNHAPSLEINAFLVVIPSSQRGKMTQRGERLSG